MGQDEEDIHGDFVDNMELSGDGRAGNPNDAGHSKVTVVLVISITLYLSHTSMHR